MRQTTKLSDTLSVHRYHYGEFKVAFLTKHSFGPFFTNERNIEKIAMHNGLDVYLFEVNLQLPNQFPFKLHEAFTLHPKTQEMYRNIDGYTIEKGIEAVIVFGSGFPYSQDFLSKLKRHAFVACYFADDPEGSELTSKPYVRFYDYAFCGGVNYDRDSLIEQKYRDWGAPRAKFIPLGVIPSSYSNEPLNFNARSVELAYVGTNALQKFFFLAKLKKHFGERFKIYGKWYNGHPSFHKDLVIKFLRLITGFPLVQELPENDKVPLYRNTKIGINFHLSYGPSNIRSYELPMNGCLQIADNEEGYKSLYEIGKEIICYPNKDATAAIELIEYYLVHEEERIAIAKAGYEKVSSVYRAEQCFGVMLDEIRAQLDARTNQKGF